MIRGIMLVAFVFPYAGMQAQTYSTAGSSWTAIAQGIEKGRREADSIAMARKYKNAKMSTNPAEAWRSLDQLAQMAYIRGLSDGIALGIQVSPGDSAIKSGAFSKWALKPGTIMPIVDAMNALYAKPENSCIAFAGAAIVVMRRIAGESAAANELRTDDMRAQGIKSCGP